MTKREYAIQETCLHDQLFCSLHGALLRMEQCHGAAAPWRVWTAALVLLQQLRLSCRPDLHLRSLLSHPADAASLSLEVTAVLTYMLMTETGGCLNERQRVVLALLTARLRDFGSRWEELYAAMRQSEAEEEHHGRYVACHAFAPAAYDLADEAGDAVTQAQRAVLDKMLAAMEHMTPETIEKNLLVICRINLEAEGRFSDMERRGFALLGRRTAPVTTTENISGNKNVFQSGANMMNVGDGTIVREALQIETR